MIPISIMLIVKINNQLAASYNRLPAHSTSTNLNTRCIESAPKTSGTNIDNPVIWGEKWNNVVFSYITYNVQ